MDYSKLKKSELVDMVRYFVRQEQVGKYAIKDSDMLAGAMRSNITRWGQENFVVVFLDNQNKIIQTQIMFIGTINRSICSPREVFIEALKCEAVKIAIGHNHPSGDIKPSVEDIAVTKRFIEAGKLLSIEVLDSIVFKQDEHFSMFAESVCDF